MFLSFAGSEKLLSNVTHDNIYGVIYLVVSSFLERKMIRNAGPDSLSCNVQSNQRLNYTMLVKGLKKNTISFLYYA